MTEHFDPSTDRALSIWFFVGILTLVYGVVLLVTGIYEFRHPLPPTIVLSELHPTFWWGLLMTIFGGFYTIRFRPGKG
jgi:di/tricarboxylate transporter